MKSDLSKAAQVKLVKEAFAAIPELQDGYRTVSERLHDMIKASEKRHRTGRGHVGISVQIAAQLFTVKYLLDGWTQPDRFSVDDILSIRNDVLYAQAYAKKFHTELEKWALQYAHAFEQVDYAFLMEVR